MSWQGILGHDQVAREFARAEFRNRLGGSFLFIGPDGVGKRTFAFALAKTLLCTGQKEKSDELADFVPCEHCESCRLFRTSPDSDASQSETPVKSPPKKIRGINDVVLKTHDVVDSSSSMLPVHPDFYYVCKPPDKTFLPLELLVGEKENRMRSGLCYEISRRPGIGRRKVAILDDADLFNPEGANAILKTLEEPPAGSILILLGTNLARQLPTIRSRCQIIRFLPLEQDDLAQLLLANKYVSTSEQSLLLAAISEGSVSIARQRCDLTANRFCAELCSKLAQGNLFAPDLARLILNYVETKDKNTDSKEKESATVRRTRLRNVLSTASDFFLNFVRANEMGNLSIVMPAYRTAVQKLIDSNLLDTENALDYAERSMVARAQIDQMINLPFIVEAWADDIAHY